MDDVSVWSLLGRLTLSLAVVLVVMALAGRLLRKQAMPGFGRAGARAGVLEVVARQSLSRTASVAVVRVADQVLVVGVTDHGVERLAELDPEALTALEEGDGDPISGPPSWRAVVDGLRDRSVRRG